jgi:hypothetical protein
VFDAHLEGVWSDGPLYQGSMESAAMVFRPDGSGWTYWARIGGVFSVHRFGWRTDSHRQLHVRLRHHLSGTWAVHDDEIRHHVDSQHTRDTHVVLTYTINPGQDISGNPATVLDLDRPVIPGTLGDRFALKHSHTRVEDPTITGTLPRGWD